MEELFVLSAPAMTILRVSVPRGPPLAGAKWRRVKRSLKEVALSVQSAEPGIIGWSITIWQPQIWQLKGGTPSRQEPCRVLRAFLVSSLPPYHSKPQRQFRSCPRRKGQANRPPKEGISFEGL